MNDIIYNNKKAVSSKIYIQKKVKEKERLVQLHRYLIGQDERINILEAIELVLLNTR